MREGDERAALRPEAMEKLRLGCTAAEAYSTPTGRRWPPTGRHKSGGPIMTNCLRLTSGYAIASSNGLTPNDSATVYIEQVRDARWFGIQARGIARIGWAAAAILAAVVSAQQIDTAIYRDQRRQFTFLDQFADPAERKALRGLYREADPAEQRRSAIVFLEAYPRSWALAQVYEIASKASIRLDDFDSALEYGRASLRLLPENALLLVSLANVQIHQDLTEESGISARTALELLDRFDRPSRFSKGEWTKLEPELRSSCYYVLGRAAASTGLASEASDRAQQLLQAQELLERSRRLNASDPSAAYLLGITQLSLGRKRQAAANFQDAYRIGGPLRQKAEAQLERLGPIEDAGGDDEFTPALSSASADRGEQESLRSPRDILATARYAGSEACRDCHQRTYDSWQQTGMARMFRPYSSENVLGDFNDKEFQGARGSPTVRMKTETGQHYFEFHDQDGTRRRYDVDYTIGSKWQQAYATELADGRIQVLPIQYNRLHQKWLNFWKVIDSPGSERADLREFHRLSSLTNYQVNCAMCHTSQLSTDVARRRPTDFVHREAGVNCEMCHGPAAGHVAAMGKSTAARWEADEPPVRFGDIAAEQYMNICGRCHMQSNVVDLGGRGEVNFTGDARQFFPTYKGRRYAEFSEKAFHRDGRFRETTFIGESFVRSACYRQGGANCGHCHDPHPADAATNPKSLKFRERPDEMCLQCHASYAQDVSAHTRHAPESRGSRCASCHMPKIMHSMLFKASTHRIDDIPDAEMTLRFGQEKSPNACLLCHADKDAAWIIEHRVVVARPHVLPARGLGER